MIRQRMQRGPPSTLQTQNQTPLSKSVPETPVDLSLAKYGDFRQRQDPCRSEAGEPEMQKDATMIADGTGVRTVHERT